MAFPFPSLLGDSGTLTSALATAMSEARHRRRFN
jgi:hypothetical protein